MFKAASIIAVPGVLGGAGLFYSPDWPESGSEVYREAYVVEMGVAFREQAVRAALPAGLEAAPGFTGGIAIYGGDEGWALSPLSTGYVWIDLAEPGHNGEPARFMVTGFAVEHEDDLETDEGDVLRTTARLDEGGLLDLAVRPAAEGCTEGLTAARGDLLTAGSGGSLGVIHLPVMLDLCKAEAISARLEAPAGHVLEALAPEQVLWAEVAAPLRWAMPEL